MTHGGIRIRTLVITGMIKPTPGAIGRTPIIVRIGTGIMDQIGSPQTGAAETGKSTPGKKTIQKIETDPIIHTWTFLPSMEARKILQTTGTQS